MTIPSARRVFLDPTGYKSNGRRDAYTKASSASTYYRARLDGRSSRLRRVQIVLGIEVINEPKSRYVVWEALKTAQYIGEFNITAQTIRTRPFAAVRKSIRNRPDNHAVYRTRILLL